MLELSRRYIYLYNYVIIIIIIFNIYLYFVLYLVIRSGSKIGIKRLRLYNLIRRKKIINNSEILGLSSVR